MVLDGPGRDILCPRGAVAACGHDLLNYLRWRFANCLFPQSSVQRQVADRLRKSNGKLTTPAYERANPPNAIGRFPHGLSITACAILSQEQRFRRLFDAEQ